MAQDARDLSSGEGKDTPTGRPEAAIPSWAKRHRACSRHAAGLRGCFFAVPRHGAALSGGPVGGHRRAGRPSGRRAPLDPALGRARGAALGHCRAAVLGIRERGPRSSDVGLQSMSIREI